MKIKSDGLSDLDKNLKINFSKIFCEPFNWNLDNQKIASIDSKKEENKRSFTNNIIESFSYLDYLYEKISFSNNIDICHFLASSIIFSSLIEKIRKIDEKFSSEILKKLNFDEIIKKNFSCDYDNSLLNFNEYKDPIDKLLIEKYIGDKTENGRYDLNFLNGIRNKLVHPNGEHYKKTHMYSICSYNEEERQWFRFGGMSHVESKENTTPTFFIKKTIFLESIKEISIYFSKNILTILKSYIKKDVKNKKPSLKILEYKEAAAKYDCYFETWEYISLLFIWSKNNNGNKNLTEYLRIVYTIAKFIKDSNNINDYDWKSWILPNIDKDIEQLMKECGFEKSTNIKENFLFIIFNKKSESDWKLLLNEIKLKFKSLKCNFSD